MKGEGCGEKKLETAEKFNTKLLDEEALLELIRSKPGKKSAYDIKVSFVKLIILTIEIYSIYGHYSVYGH